MKRWVQTGDCLQLEDGSRRSSATAEQIFASIVESSPPWSDLTPGKSRDLADLEFSRYPVLVQAVLTVDRCVGQPRVTLEAVSQQGLSFPVSEEAVSRGHVIYDGTWFPLAPDCGPAIRSLMREASVDLETGLVQSFKGFLALRKTAAHGGPVVDRLNDAILWQSAFRPPGRGGPEGVRATLYPYQLDGWRWLSLLVREGIGGLLGDEMGLGKTLQVISVVSDPGATDAARHVLVIAPGSILENWTREVAKFCPGLSTCRHHGPMRTGLPSALASFDIVLTSYDTAVRDLSLLKMVTWDVVVLDEAQYIRNPAALRTRSIKELPRRASLAVTGTPVENRLRDLWSIMDFAMPGYLGTQEEFEAHHGDDREGAISLERLASPLLLRRRVSEHASDLPERMDALEMLEMTGDEACAYESVRSRILAEYGMSGTLVALTRLRQFCSHPEVVGPDTWAGAAQFTKLDRLLEILSEVFAWSEKALVFTSWNAMADQIVGACQQRFGSSAMAETLDGRLATGNRQRLLDRFATHRGPGVLVLNPRAGGVGLNITAANHVIHYNPEWNPAVEDQASARVHRRGQERPVMVRRLVFAETVEEVVIERLTRKRRLAERSVVGVEGSDSDRQDVLAALNRSPLVGETAK